MWRDDYRSVISPAVLTVPVRIVTVSLDKRILICAYLISSLGMANETAARIRENPWHR
jgi:hypothetical protein